jgi:hypothetical protein
MSSLVIYGLSHLQVFTSKGAIWFQLTQVIGLFGAIGTLLVIYNAIRAWLKRGKSIWFKLQSTLFVLACLGFLWFAFVGGLLSLNTGF